MTGINQSFIWTGSCFTCGLPFEKGIEVGTDNDELFHFCSNEHYVHWWKNQHPDATLAWDYAWD